MKKKMKKKVLVLKISKLAQIQLFWRNHRKIKNKNSS